MSFFKKIAKIALPGISNVGDFVEANIDPVGYLHDRWIDAGFGGDWFRNIEELRRDFYNPIRGMTNYFMRQMPAIPSADQVRRMSTDQGAPRRLIYGTARVGGQLVFLRTSGANSEYLHLVLVLADHEVDSIGDIYLGEKLATDARFSGKVTIVSHLGAESSQPFPTLVAENIGWTSSHLLAGCAAVYVKLLYSRDAYPNGIPKINAIVRGKKDLLDPRTGLTGYSDNWALVAYDYMRFARGMNADAAEIDTASVIAAADICDELVVADQAGLTTEKRYTVNGAVELVGSPLDAIKILSIHASGRIYYSGGVWRVVAGAYSAPVATLSESDLAGGLSFASGAGKSERINTMYGSFTSVELGYVAADLPVMRIDAYVAADLEELRGDVALPLCTSASRAQRIQKVTLEKSRRGMVCTFPAKYTATALSPMDRVAVTIAALGWSNKIFLVDDYDFGVRGGVGLRLVEDDPALYGWTAGEVVPVVRTPLTGLPDPYTVTAPTNLVMASGTAHLLLTDSGTIISRILVSWTPPASPFVDGYDIEYRVLGATVWSRIQSEATSVYIPSVQDGRQYEIQVRARNAIGVRSGWLSGLHLVIGKSEPPPHPETFLVQRLSDGTREFRWSLANPPADVRVGGGYRIRYKSGTGHVWADMDELHTGVLLVSPYECNQLPAGEYTFAIKTVDSSGNESLEATYIVASLGDPRVAGLLASVDPRALGWPGTLTHCYAGTDGSLYAADQKTWADFDIDAINWDAWLAWTRDPYLSFVYEHPAIDLGVVTRFSPGAAVIGNGTPTVEVSVSDDNVTYGPWVAAGGAMIARYVKVRVTMTVASGVASLTSMVIQLTANVVYEDIEDLDTSTLTPEAGGGVRLPLSTSFSVIRKVDLALQNVGSRCTWELIDKSTAGPWVKIYDSTGALIYPVIDATIKGL